ncbi:MAG: DUF423 domain-containing protein [Chitinophagaceae bacterium]|nr:DUF423 domain-containing protein [Chitinophagaceae bacterium]
MLKTNMLIASMLAALAVALGAFGAHGLKNYADEATLNTFETAVRYQFYHALALLIAGILFKNFPDKKIKNACTFFIVGICLFSGSLYILTLLKINTITGLNFIGAITPVGGLSFILGWLFLALGINAKLE